MTLRGTFAIEGSFKVTGRAFVIYGDIVDGVVSKQDFLCFLDSGQEINLKISDVNFVDKISERGVKVGLTIYYENDEDKKRLDSLKVLAQTGKILSG